MLAANLIKAWGFGQSPTFRDRKPITRHLLSIRRGFCRGEPCFDGSGAEDYRESRVQTAGSGP